MKQEWQVVHWVCLHCGGSGETRLPIDLGAIGYVAELVRAHSLACGGCDGNARTSLRTRTREFSDQAWEQFKQLAKRTAASKRHSDRSPVLVVAGEPRFSVSALRQYLDGGPRWF